MATIEYRKLFRASVCLEIRYKAIKEPKVSGISFSRNISSIGINVIMPHSLKEGEEIGLEIFLAGIDQPVSARGKVVWQRPCTFQPESKKRYYSTGIHFLEMASGDAIKTSDFIGEIVRKQRENEDRMIIEKLESILKGKG